jgi:hypothetical protein
MADCAAARRTNWVRNGENQNISRDAVNTPAFLARLPRLSSALMSTPGSGFDGQIIPPGGYVPIDPAAREMIGRHLDPGEDLLWAGRAKFSGFDVCAILLAAIWTFALLQRILDPSHPWTNHKQMILYSIVTLPLCTISVFLRGGIFYGVTDRRVLWLSTRFSKRSLFDLPLCDALGHPLKIFRRPFGILEFGGSLAEALARPKEAYFAFFIGSRAPVVYQMIVATERKLVDEAESAAIAALSAEARSARHP